jgi:hypothetical protein
VKKIWGKLTYANVVSTLCLFLLLGGGAALAATKLPKGSVGSAQLRRNAVTGAKIKPGAISGSKIKLATLGAVPSAAFATRAAEATRADSAATAANATTATTAGDARTLQGTGLDGLVRGGGHLVSGRVDLKVGEEGAPLVQLPGVGSLSAKCTAGTTAAIGDFKLVNTSGRDETIGLQYQGGSDGGTLVAGDFTDTGGEEGSYAFTWQFSTNSGPNAIGTVSGSFVSTANTGCRFIAQGTTQP